MIEWSLKRLGEVNSTQTVAVSLGAEGAPEGTVVVASRQTRGRGRHGRAWRSPEGGLYMSALLRPPSSERIQTLTLLAALAVARGIEDATGQKASVRWPNDVVIEGKKVSGVIAEASYGGQTPFFVAVGIGVNCNSTVPSKIDRNSATSLSDELGEQVDIGKLAKSILGALGSLYEGWLKGVGAVETARGRISTVGKRVNIETTSGKSLEGVAEGLDPDGRLILKTKDGNVTLRAEDVERLRE